MQDTAASYACHCHATAPVLWHQRPTTNHARVLPATARRLQINNHRNHHNPATHHRAAHRVLRRVCVHELPSRGIHNQDGGTGSLRRLLEVLTTSTPQARDLKRATWTPFCFARDVKYSDALRSFSGSDGYLRNCFVADCVEKPKARTHNVRTPHASSHRPFPRYQSWACAWSTAEVTPPRWNGVCKAHWAAPPSLPA